MDKKLLGLLTIFFVITTVFVSVVVLREPLSVVTRASVDTEPSGGKSVVLAYPLRAKANNTDSVSVTVFARSESGKPVVGRDITATTTLGRLTPGTQKTDSEGKVVFTLVSATPGFAKITAVVNGTVTVAQSPSVEFEVL